MANNDNATGLTLARSLGSGYMSGSIERFVALAATGTAIYVGGLVKPAGTADADGVMDITGNVSTGDAVLGVVTSIEPITADSKTYREASTLRYVYVCTNADAIYEVQASGAMAITAAANTADLTGFTAGSTVTGRSTIEVSSGTETASGDGTEDVLIMGFVQREDNDVGEVNAKLLVRLNNHFFTDAAAGA